MLRITRLEMLPELEVVESPLFTPAQLHAVREHWSAATRESPSLFDATITCLLPSGESPWQVFIAPYSLWHAQFSGAIDLGIDLLAVSGLIETEDGVLLARRGAESTQDPGRWELAPAGGVTIEHPRKAAGALMAQFQRELHEELNISSSELRAASAYAMVMDDRARVTDVVIRALSPLTRAELDAVWSGRTSNEYLEVGIFDLSQLGELDLTEASRCVLEMLE